MTSDRLAAVSAVFPVTGRLRFTDDLEPGFTEYHIQRALPFTRLALILALTLYALFGVLDFYIVRDAAKWIWVILAAALATAASRSTLPGTVDAAELGRYPGNGFDAQSRGLGAGFLNMADRLGALGGSLRVQSAPRQGTTVSGTVPAEPLAARPLAAPAGQ